MSVDDIYNAMNILAGYYLKKDSRINAGIFKR